MKIEKDKQKHLAAGFMIALIAGILINPIVGYFGAILAGIAKEVYDFKKTDTFDNHDLLATVIGGIVGAVVAGFIS